MVTVVNGKLPASMLVAIPGGRLRADAAASWLRLREVIRTKYGWAPNPTSYHDAYRSYEWQERIFLQRYTTSRVTGIDPRYWQGKTWWRLPGTASAATPGRSNHGLGVAVDVPNLGGFNGTRYGQFAHEAAKHGWDNRTGRAINEPWHWEYEPRNDTRPAPVEEEVDLTPQESQMLNEIHGRIIRANYLDAKVSSVLLALTAVQESLNAIRGRTDRYLDTKVSDARNAVLAAIAELKEP